MSGFLPVKQWELSNSVCVRVCVRMCVCACVLRLPLQADQVSQTNTASSTSLSFGEHTLVPRVHCLKNQRGLSTIECTWARRALRMKSSSIRKYAKEVIEPFFFSLSFIRIASDVFCGQPSGMHTQLDSPAEIEKKSISSHVFYFIFHFLATKLLPPTLSSNLQRNGFMKL